MNRLQLALLSVIVGLLLSLITDTAGGFLVILLVSSLAFVVWAIENAKGYFENGEGLRDRIKQETLQEERLADTKPPLFQDELYQEENEGQDVWHKAFEEIEGIRDLDD